MFLARHGYESVYNLTGGVDAWARQVDTTMPTY
jgi:rhodanese-related sulfurtransferase